jgi:alkylresorcinol/alkylpyrone synthase
MKITSVASALAPHVYDQATLTEFLRRTWRDDPDALRRLDSLHASVSVKHRHLALPIDAYERLRTFGDFNDAWISCATDLGERAITVALERAGLRPTDVDAIFFSTVTGIAVPSIDARLVNRMGLRTDIKRTPIFGLGCVAGAAALSRAVDFVRGAPNAVAVVLTVELCSLTFQRDDASVANLISTGLFGDGAAAAVVVGANRSAANAPRVIDTRSVFYPDTEDVMGWKISERGLKIVLSARVPAIAREFLSGDVKRFLAEHDLAPKDIAAWVCHPGGPKVLDAIRDGLELDESALAISRESLAETGNLSSASALLILERTLERRRPQIGERGLMMAMGPGFCSELLLLEW